MTRLLFFIRAYPGLHKLQLLLLLLAQTLRLNNLTRWFPDYLVESRSILGFVLDNKGNAFPTEAGMQVSFFFHSKHLEMLLRWSSSDFLAFNQVFILEEYEPLTTLEDTQPVIVDAGANIGCTTIYLSVFYPQARFIAIEPDAENFQSMKRNFNLCKLNVTTFLSALWHTNGRVSITPDHRDRRDWSRKVVETGMMNVEAKTLQTILQEADCKKVDILKMDIEGSEEEMIERDFTLRDAIGSARLIAVEAHRNAGKLIDWLTIGNFQCVQRNETIIATPVFST
jgi:FkbM family methyltransferase